MFTDNFGNFTDVNVTIEEYLLYGSEGLENRGSLCHNYNVNEKKKNEFTQKNMFVTYA